MISGRGVESGVSVDEKQVLEDLRVLTTELVEYTSAARNGHVGGAFPPEDERIIGHDMMVLGQRLKAIADQRRRERDRSDV